jgi:PAS domain S-box-containing protein
MADKNTLFKLVDLPPLRLLVPDTLRGTNTFDEQRARVIVLVSVSTALLGPVFAIVFWLVGNQWIAVPFLVGGLLMLTPPLILRQTSSFEAVGNWFAALSFAALCAIVWMSGGTQPEALVWLFFPPVVAMVFAGIRSGGVWTAICMATCGLFFGLEMVGFRFPDLVAEDSLAIGLGGPAALIGLNSLCFLLHTHLQGWLVDSLQQAQDQALSASHQSFRTLIEHAPEGIVVLRAEGPPVYVNPALSEMLGYPLEEARQTLPGQVMSADEAKRFAQIRAKLGQTAHLDISYESTRTRKDGSKIDVEVRHFFSSFKGDPALYVRIRDITERNQLQAKMMRMDRMIAVGTLAAGVGHEINNPLAFVSANATLLLTEHQGGAFDSWEPPKKSSLDHDELQEILEDITEGSERIRHIVSDLRSFAQVEQGDKEPGSVDLAKLLDSAIKMAHHEIKHRARLVTEIDDVPPVLGDNANLGQVFLNLVINAAHAIPSGDRDNHRICVRAEHVREGRVCVTISDTGSGIPEDVQPRIFDPFFTTKSDENGMGLGLYITQGIVQDSGGEITFESTPGDGTTFRVCLPTSTQKPSDLSGPLPATTSRTHSASVLVIDDEPKIVRTLKRALVGFDVTTQNSARAALEQLRQGEDFDLILCDLLMPQMSGMEFFTHLQEEFEQMTARVVFMTGGTFTQNSRAFVESSGRPVVQKPFDLHKLRETLSEQLSVLDPTIS